MVIAYPYAGSAIKKYFSSRSAQHTFIGRKVRKGVSEIVKLMHMRSSIKTNKTNPKYSLTKAKVNWWNKRRRRRETEKTVGCLTYHRKIWWEICLVDQFWTLMWSISGKWNIFDRFHYSRCLARKPKKMTCFVIFHRWRRHCSGIPTIENVPWTYYTETDEFLLRFCLL